MSLKNHFVLTKVMSIVSRETVHLHSPKEDGSALFRTPQQEWLLPLRATKFTPARPHGAAPSNTRAATVLAIAHPCPSLRPARHPLHRKKTSNCSQTQNGIMKKKQQ